MNFDIVEGLSEEDVISIYNSSLFDRDKFSISDCYCFSGTGKNGHIAFGHQNQSSHGLGYCALQISYESYCKTWCENHGFTYVEFTPYCFCDTVNYLSQWYICR